MTQETLDYTFEKYAGRQKTLKPSKEFVRDIAKKLAFKNDSPRFVVIDGIRKNLQLDKRLILKYYKNILISVSHELRSYADIMPTGTLVFNDSEDELDGVRIAEAVNRGALKLDSKGEKIKLVSRGLHWDLEGDCPFFALIFGERQNLCPASAETQLTDFNQWYADQGFEKPLHQLTSDEKYKLLNQNHSELTQDYTILLPNALDDYRLLIVNNNPNFGGLLHGVTRPKLVDPNQRAKRELQKFYLLSEEMNEVLWSIYSKKNTFKHYWMKIKRFISSLEK